MGTKQFKGRALSWQVQGGVIEIALHREPCNEIGSLSLSELEQFASALDDLEKEAHALIIHSEMKPGFCAGADLRELYERSQTMENSQAARGVRDFLERIHRVLNRIDASFTFKDGKIVRHVDAFDLRRWAGMALGLKGKLLGWLPAVQNAIRKQGDAGLRAYMAKHG